MMITWQHHISLSYSGLFLGLILSRVWEDAWGKWLVILDVKCLNIFLVRSISTKCVRKLGLSANILALTPHSEEWNFHHGKINLLYFCCFFGTRRECFLLIIQHHYIVIYPLWKNFWLYDIRLWKYSDFPPLATS